MIRHVYTASGFSIVIEPILHDTATAVTIRPQGKPETIVHFNAIELACFIDELTAAARQLAHDEDV